MQNHINARVWAMANTGNLFHAFVAPWTDENGNESTQHLRAMCRGTIARHKDSVFYRKAELYKICTRCEAKWDAHIARVERSMEPLQPCESVAAFGAAPVEAPCCEHASMYHGNSGCDECGCPTSRAAMPAHGGTVPAAPVRRDRHTARRVLADRRRTNRAAAKLRRRGVATVAGHCIAAGLRPLDARSMASSLRRNAVKAGCEGRTGTSHAGRRPARACTRYTPSEVAVAASAYQPRRDDFRAVRAALMAVSS
ncbi:hypothetical protein [Streptomyces sp. bgisy126]|uniref:hypothetical protein n=1 Tax=unclassified Streptomyces TaxID=2593676 RepID=UPI003EC0C8F6